MKGGFAESPLRMNKGLAKLERWTEDAIRERAGTLAARAVGVWSTTKLAAGVLDAYKPKVETTAGYTIEDHRIWSPGRCGTYSRHSASKCGHSTLRDRGIPEALRRYKAETNFVDVIPQAKRLRLSLNIAFPEISDPKGICVDVTGLGRWGNGDVRVELTSLDELPYAMGLVRQSFEKQMGNGGDA